MPVNVKPLIDNAFGIKSLKKWNAMEGQGYSFTLTHNGKLVAEVLQDGNGGATRVNWVGLRWDGSMIPNQSPADTKKAGLAQAAKTAFDAIVRAAPTFESGGMTLTVDADLLLEALLEHLEMQKLCKTKTVFRLPKDPNRYNVLKAPFDSEVRAYVLKHWPTAIIVNENPFA